MWGDDDAEEWRLLARADTRDPTANNRPVSHPKLLRPTSAFTRGVRGGPRQRNNPRFRADNVLTFDLDMPERTTTDYETDINLGVRAALTAALRRRGARAGGRENRLHAGRRGLDASRKGARRRRRRRRARAVGGGGGKPTQLDELPGWTTVRRSRPSRPSHSRAARQVTKPRVVAYFSCVTSWRGVRVRFPSHAPAGPRRAPIEQPFVYVGPIHPPSPASRWAESGRRHLQDRRHLLSPRGAGHLGGQPQPPCPYPMHGPAWPPCGPARHPRCVGRHRAHVPARLHLVN